MEYLELMRTASNEEILYAAIRGLNSIYSLGGVSCGRSPRSNMLEVIRSCLFSRNSRYFDGPTEMICAISENVPFESLLSEVLERANGTRKISMQLKLFDHLSLEHMDDEELAEVAAACMLDWYEQDKKRYDPVSLDEYNLAKAIIKMISPPEIEIGSDLARRVYLVNEDRYYADLKKRQPQEFNLYFED